MPDPNEIAAAAERLPILEKEIADFGPVDFGPVEWDIERFNALEAKLNEVHRLSRILADAYLDEHADDLERGASRGE